jgi:hypothetical protein
MCGLLCIVYALAFEEVYGECGYSKSPCHMQGANPMCQPVPTGRETF